MSAREWFSAHRAFRWTLSGICVCFFWSVDLGEASVMTPQSFSRTEMSHPRPVQRPQAPPPARSGQLSLVFESTGMRGLPTAERTKALTNLAHLLLLAAGVVVEETDDER